MIAVEPAPLSGTKLILAGVALALANFVLSLIGFGFFSLMCGLSRNLEMLVIFRIFQGLSGGPLMPLSQALLLRVFPKHLGGAALGLWAMTTVCAPIAGPILAGLISDNWTWPWIFLINLPVVAVCIFAVSNLVIPFETKRANIGIDKIGLILLVVWVGAFQLMLDTGRENDWFASPFVVAMAAIAAIGLPAFWTCNGLVPVTCLSSCHLSFESQRAYTAQI